MFIVTYESRFPASHYVREYKGKGEPLHSHNWRVEVSVKSEEMDNVGIAFDFEDLKKETESLVSRLKEKNLNELEEFQETNPTAENLAKWFSIELRKKIIGIQLDSVRIWEAYGCSVLYRE
jgi:6-pyruvoyltetrahydropterin/6-carboxytetrahydropterin synthase